MTLTTRVALCVACCALRATNLDAQPGQRPTPDAQRTAHGGVASDSLQVYLITLGEGAQYWEKYGHNALWFRDPTTGVDLAYNWGTFDFTAPDFMSRILIGDTKYSVEAIPAPLFIDFYRQYDRTIVVQRLNLSAAQARKAQEYARWNAREENKYYRYDYFRDNCSTRVRDVIDLALGGALKGATGTSIVKRTYRSETLRLVDDMKLIQFGIDVALAQPSDKPLTLWEDMFVPARLRDALRDIRVPGPGGSVVPLVTEDRVVYESQNHVEREDVPALWLPYLLIGMLLAVEFFGVGIAARRSPAVAKVFRFEIAVWALLTGLLGLVLLLAWLITQHVFWYRNENLLLVNPLSLFLAVLAPLAIWKRRFARPAAICAVLVAMLSALALIVKGLPWFTQDNVPLILLFLPPHFAIAYWLWRHEREATAERSPFPAS